MWSVIGQKKAVSLLQRSLEKDSLAHAYLFVGPAHVGKMTLALDLAKVLNCPEAEPPCGQCSACNKIAEARHADVQIIGLSHNEAGEAGSRMEISIDQIRQIQHSVSLPPFEGRYRVFIIEGAELLSTEAANCLLKTLEEPVGKVVFVLLTTNERLLPVTVISRCQRVELLPVAVSEVESALSSNWGVAPEKARLLAALSHGCLGWAVSARDDHQLQKRTEHLGELLNMVSADDEERFAYAAKLATQFSRDRESVQERLNLWLDWWHDLLMGKGGSRAHITNVDQLTMLVDRAQGYHLVQIKDFINSIRAAGEQLKQNANPRLVLEVLMLSLPEGARRSQPSPAARVEVN